VVAWVAGFSFFAFITTLTREIIKDIEDFEGDNAYGRKTLPIMLGVTYSKWVVIGLNIITVGALVLVYFRYLKDNVTLIYMLLTMLVPYAVLTYRMLKADSKQDYRFASNLSKFIMLAGIFYSLVVYFIISVKF
jgi:4-hydroxybenzoate polyprenyltransferase